MVRDIPSRQISSIADQIARVEAHRGLTAVYVQVVAPPHVDPEQVGMLLSALLRDRGSSAEVGVVHAKVDRIALHTLEFSMDD